MSNSIGIIISGVAAILVGAILLFMGYSVLNISPESNAPDGSMQQQLENMPRSFGWAFVLGGVFGLFMGILLIIVGVKS